MRLKRQTAPIGNVLATYYYSSYIRSIQRGTVTLAAVASNTATITAVVAANAYVSYLGTTTTDTVGNASDTYCKVVLTNATTVTASRSGNTGTVLVSFEVIEFMPGVLKSLQVFAVALTGAASGTATVVAVNTGKSFLVWGGNTNTGAAVVPDQGQAKVVLTNTTTVTGTSNTATTGSIAGTVVEFK